MTCAIATLSGRVIDFLEPDPEQIHLDDIAVSLARQPRFTGQTIRPWSVAQHSLLVAHLVVPSQRLHALLHDAPEAFTCDAASPFKLAMRQLAGLGNPSHYDILEERLWRAICRRYDIVSMMPAGVSDADYLAMLIEAPNLQPLGWEHAVWDEHRELATMIAPAMIRELWRIASLENGGYAAWMLAVTDELAARRPQ
jgi:hypothetical protein